MMSTADKLLVSILKYGDSTLLFRIKDEWLDSSELPKLRYILDYIGKYDELVGVKAFCDEYSLNRKEVDSRPGVYFRSVKDRYKFARIANDIPSIIKNAKKDIDGSLHQLTELVSHLNNDEDTDSIDTRYSDAARTRLDKYKERVASKGIMYLSMGHPVLDEVFLGYGKTSLITIGGRAGSKKTFLLCFLALLADAILPDDYGPIMFLSNEMSTDEILDRMDAIRFHLPFGEFLRGKLTRQQYKRYEKGVSLLDDSRIIFLENVYTMKEYNNKLRIYRPGLSFIDGSYLMEPEYKGDDWKRITYVTRYLKRIHKTIGSPCVNSTQLKRATGKNQKATSFDAQDDFAYASSYTQDSDIAIRMYADKEMVFRSEVGMEIAKGRNVDSTQIPVFVANMVKMDFHFVLTDANGEEVGTPNDPTPVTPVKNTKVKW
jgi:replicative DNA helicase